MKFLKQSFLVFILSFLLIFLIGCPVSENVQSENQERIQQIQNTYFNYPLRGYPIGKTEGNQMYWGCPDNDFGHYLTTYRGYHPGEDWQLIGGENGEVDNGKPVYSIGAGKVVEVSSESLGNLGYLVVIEHTGSFLIPSKKINSNGQTATYKEEIVDKINSVYLHIENIKVKEGDIVNENTILGYIMNPGDPKMKMGSHLHFEIRKDLGNHSPTWSMLGSKTNWQYNKVPDKKDPTKLVKSYNGYYINLQKMIDSGLRDPSEFIEANSIGNKVKIGSPQTIPETSVSIESETVTVEEKGKKGKVVFIGEQSNESNSEDLYVINIDGTNLQKITNNSENEYINGFDYSIKNGNLLYASNTSIKMIGIDDNNKVVNSKILVLNNDQIFSKYYDYTIAFYYPKFFRDNTSILFNCITGGSGNGGDSDIFSLDLINGNIENITNNKEGNWYPVFSKSRNMIFYESIGRIIAMSLSDKTKKEISRDKCNYSPILSMDEQKLIFTSGTDDDEIPEFLEILQADLNKSDILNLTNNGCANLYPILSSKGYKISFISSKDYKVPKEFDSWEGYDLYLMDINLKSTKRITNDKEWETPLAFIDNDNKIIFIKDRLNKNIELYTYDINNKDKKTLFKIPFSVPFRSESIKIYL